MDMIMKEITLMYCPRTCYVCIVIDRVWFYLYYEFYRNIHEHTIRHIDKVPFANFQKTDFVVENIFTHVSRL